MADIALDTSWTARANCRGVHPDLFYPERGASTREAKEVCRACAVRNECLEYALAIPEKFGIWGGLSERERRRLRRDRNQARRAAQATHGQRAARGPDPAAQWWTSADVARYLQITVKAVRYRVAKGHLPPPDQPSPGRTSPNKWRPHTITRFTQEKVA